MSCEFGRVYGLVWFFRLRQCVFVHVIFPPLGCVKFNVELIKFVIRVGILESSVLVTPLRNPNGITL